MEKCRILSIFDVCTGTGDLALLNQQCVRGAAPCHLSVDPCGKVLLAANYGDGTVTEIVSGELKAGQEVIVGGGARPAGASSPGGGPRLGF